MASKAKRKKFIDALIDLNWRYLKGLITKDEFFSEFNLIKKERA